MKQIVVGVFALVAVLGLAVSAQTDVTGTWNAVVELDAGAGEPTFTFAQDGETLTGTYNGQLGAADLTGTVTGDMIEFSFGVDVLGTASYTGKIMGDTMEGTCDYGGQAAGTWTARKRE